MARLSVVRTGTDLSRNKDRVKLVNIPAVRLPLNIRSDYYRDKELVRQIRSAHAINAGANAGKAMRRNKYEANVVEVYSIKTGKLYAVIKRDMDGNVHTLYQNKYSLKEE